MVEDMKWATLHTPPDDDRWSHTGIAVLMDGRLVFGEAGGYAIRILEEETHTDTLVNVPAFETHGILIANVDGEDSVWIADPGPPEGAGAVMRVSLDGEVLARVEDPLRMSVATHWRPTSVAVVDSGDCVGDVWVADGYGRSLVHIFRADGSTFTLDGSSTGSLFDCPHGIALDSRGDIPMLVIADRSNCRLVFFSTAGAFLKEVSSPLLTSPSSIAVWGRELVITDLFGSLLRLNEQDEVRLLLGGTDMHERDGWPNRLESGRPRTPSWRDSTLNSPHGVAVGPRGEIYLTEWCLGGRLSKIAFEELPPQGR